MNPRMLLGMSWRMAEVYAACTDQLLINIARHFKYIKDGAPIPGSWDYNIRKLAEMDALTRESEEIILKMLGDADFALRGALEAAIRDGLKDADPILQKAAAKGLAPGGRFINLEPNQMQAFRAYYQQSADRMNLVNTVMLDSTERAYQATVADIAGKIDATQGILNTATGQIVTGVEAFNTVQRNAVRRMIDNGLTGYIDHGGHHWSPEAYVAMDMRTTMTNVAREAVSERMDGYGCELYQVSYHDGARPLCYPWQGKVISRNGWTGEVEDIDGNKVQVHAESEIESFRYGGGLFGVNCGHYQIPFFAGMSRIRPPEQDEKQNAKEYAESQEQRALERKVRAEKRELEVMKAQGAPQAEIDVQRVRIKKANAELDDFCKQTGRARQPGRTATPINATFPDGYKQTYYERGIKRRDPNATPAARPARPAAAKPAAKPAAAPAAPAVNPRLERIKEYTDRINEYDKRIAENKDAFDKFISAKGNGPGTPAYDAEQKRYTDTRDKLLKERDKLKEERGALEYVQNLPATGIMEKPLTAWDHTPKTEEIIASLGGLDKTKGSCASLTFAYAGNRGGYNVLDFRNGDSRYHFSMCKSIDTIAKIPGVDGIVLRNKSDFTTAHKLMAQMTEGKEYFFGVAKHAAVVRKTATGYEYLELQGEASYNGFKELNDFVLKWRFGCQKSHTIAGFSHEVPGELMEIDKLKNNPDFLDVLKYINTAAADQAKGAGGGLR